MPVLSISSYTIPWNISSLKKQRFPRSSLKVGGKKNKTNPPQKKHAEAFDEIYTIYNGWKNTKKSRWGWDENVFEWMKKLNYGHINHLLRKVQTTVQMGASARLVSTKVLISRWTCGVTIDTRVPLKHSNIGIWKYQLHDPCRCHINTFVTEMFI